MAKLVESLTRLYPNSISIDQLKAMVDKKSITPEEFKNITGEDFGVNATGGDNQ